MPEAQKVSVEKSIQRLRMRLPVARWTQRSQWHCTVKFLGEVAEERLQEVEELTARATAAVPPSTTRLTEIGAFPNLRRARVIWVGLEDPNETLAHLAAGLERRFGGAGLREESRHLHPHITIARLKIAESVQSAVAECGPYDFDHNPFPVTETVLFASRLSRAGSSYEALSRFKLGA